MSQVFAEPVISPALNHTIRSVVISEIAVDIATAFFDKITSVLYVHPTGEFVDTVGEVNGQHGSHVLALRVWNTKKDVEEEAMMAVVSDLRDSVTTLEFSDTSNMARIGQVLKSRVIKG